MRGDETSQSTKCGTAKGGSTRGSRAIPRLNRIPEVRSPNRKKEKRKWKMCKFCLVVKSCKH